MIIKLKKKWLEHQAGDTVDTADETGRMLVEQGYAEPVHPTVNVIEKQAKPVNKVKVKK